MSLYINGIIAHWIARNIHLSRMCLLITESSWQSYEWAYEGMRPEQQLYTLTGPWLTIGILEIETLRNNFDMQEELDAVLRKIKIWKTAGLDEIPTEVWKTKEFDDILLRHCTAVYNQNTIDKWMHPPLPEERWLRINQELPGYNPYIYSSQDLQCSITQPYRTQNWEDT